MKNLSNNSSFDFSALGNMCQWERQKALYLMQMAEEIGIEYADSYGCIAVNNTSGYTYLWCEDYSFTLYMPINCDLTPDHVFVMWTNYETGEETERQLSKFMDSVNTLEAIQEWTEQLNEIID